MIRNFLAVAVRNFMRQPLYSFINAIGLASGLMCTIFICLWVVDEVSKDKFHQDSEKIFLLISNLDINKGETMTWTNTPGPLAEAIRQNVPDVTMSVRMARSNARLFQHEDKSFMENGCYSDPEFFQFFSFKIILGKANTDSLDNSTISISRTLAEKLFGHADPIGKLVRFNNDTDFKIGAVFENIGSESSLTFEFVLPYALYKKNMGNNFTWGNYDHPTYIKLVDEQQAAAVLKKIQAVVPKGEQTAGLVLTMQPFGEHYLHGTFENGKPVGGRIKYVQIFSAVAIFILIIACINFMNMATAKAASRAKEVGIRKVVGAQRRSLILQFIGESTLICLASALVAVAVVTMLLPAFNSLVNKQITLSFIDLRFIGGLVVIIVVTGFLAGSYPALFLSSYQPASVLKSSSTQPVGGSRLRQGLVIFQFVITVVLVACSLVIYTQIEFIRNTDIGYNRQSVLMFTVRGDMSKNFEAFKTESLQFAGIKQISRADNSLVQVQNQNGSVEWPGKPDKAAIFFRTVVVDYDFLETMGIKLKEGRFFDKAHNDTSTFVITEKSVEIMGLKDPVGTKITQWGEHGTVIGVAEDFHSQSMHDAIDPIVFMFQPKWTGRVFVRFEGQQVKPALEKLEDAYKKYNPQFPFTYTFLDDDFEKMYNNEKVTGSLALGFTFMAIIISGLGLLGLAAFTAERKKKEISIRKILGASVPRLVSGMAADFARLSVIAAVIGCPLAYWLMKQFLEGYAYHTELRWSQFTLTAVSVMILAVLTVILQVTRAAIANPVDALRNE